MFQQWFPYFPDPLEGGPVRISIIVRSVLLPALVLVLFCSCSEPVAEDSFPRLTGDYFGQVPPGTEPELFAPGLISSGLIDRDLVMTPDGNEIYFTISTPGYAISTIVETHRVDDVWSKPEVASFCTNPAWTAGEPSISPDGQKFYFISNRPDNTGEEPDDSNIWAMDRVGDGWGEPYNLGAPINTDAQEFYPSTTSDGTLYFTRADPQTRVHNIYRSRFVDGAYAEPELLPEEINAGRGRFHSFVAPDESYVIVPVAGLEDSRGGVDYYICFRDESDKWSAPINMGDGVNSSSMNEWSMFVTHDSKYMFFMSSRLAVMEDSPPNDYQGLIDNFHSPQNGNPDIYWINAGFIEDLRAEASAATEGQEDSHE